MIRTALAMLALTAALACSAGAAPPEVTPVPPPDATKWTEMKVAAGELVVLSAAPASEWEAVDGPTPHVFESGRYAVFLLTAGERRKVTVTGPDKSKTRLVLVAGDAPPVPPGPGPGPKPPVPPAPPVDPLKAKIKAAVDGDAEKDTAKKAEQVKDLAAVYRQVAKAASDKTLLTAGDFVSTAKKAAAAMVGDGVLAGVRNDVTAKELGLIFAADGPLTDDQRKAAADLFTRLATILEGL